MQRRRGDGITTEMLTNGPAKFCRAFAIGRKENGTDLLGSDIFISEGKPAARREIGASPRIGIRLATEYRWRYFLKENSFVSGKKLTAREGGTAR